MELYHENIICNQHINVLELCFELKDIPRSFDISYIYSWKYELRTYECICYISGFSEYEQNWLMRPEPI